MSDFLMEYIAHITFYLKLYHKICVAESKGPTTVHFIKDSICKNASTHIHEYKYTFTLYMYTCSMYSTLHVVYMYMYIEVCNMLVHCTCICTCVLLNVHQGNKEKVFLFKNNQHLNYYKISPTMNT